MTIWRSQGTLQSHRSRWDLDYSYARPQVIVVCSQSLRPHRFSTRSQPNLCRGYSPTPSIDLVARARALVMNTDTDQFRQNISLNSGVIPIMESQNAVFCDALHGRPTPVVPAPHHCNLFSAYFGATASAMLVTERFLRLNAGQDVCQCVRDLLQCYWMDVHGRVKNQTGIVSWASLAFWLRTGWTH